MITVDDFYTEVKECTIKREVYSVRDNGAVMRHQREGKRIRKLDSIWTFGKTDAKSGYKYIGTERVHRVVAVAFLGEPPTKQHIVDHIDTNRQNNRPENLRWLTKLENALNNPITRARIENICGSIDVFLKNPEILRGHEKIDPNFSWMRAVSPDEAKASYGRLTKWASERPIPKGGKLGEWIFQESGTQFSLEAILESIKNDSRSNEFESLTRNVIQVNWTTPTEFPLCPHEKCENPLEEYKSQLSVGAVFSRNIFNESLVLDAAYGDDGTALYVMSKSSQNDPVKPWFLAKVFFKDGIYYHESIRSYFKEDGALKDFILAKGEEWNGGIVFDELC